MTITSVSRYAPPFGGASFSDTVDQLFREAFSAPRMRDAGTAHRRAPGFGPGSNLYETADSYIMQVVLPAVNVDELTITALQNVLTLEGTAGVVAPEAARGLWVGLGYGPFREQVTLPGEMDADQATAAYRDGILTLTVPKAVRNRPYTIKVGAQAAPPAVEDAGA